MAMVETVTVHQDGPPTRAARGRRRQRRRWPAVTLTALALAAAAVAGVTHPQWLPAPVQRWVTEDPTPGKAPAEPEVEEEPTAQDELPPVDPHQAATVEDRLAAFADTAPTETGAAQAATAEMSVFGSTDMFRPGPRAAVLAAVIDPKAPASYVRSIQTGYTKGLGRLGLTADGQPPAGMEFHARELILGVDVTDFGHQPKKDGGHPVATVELWHGGLVGLTGEASSMPVRVGFNTTTITMRHDGSTWRWTSHTRKDGPVPVSDLQLPSGSDDLEDALNNTEEPTYA